MESMRTYDFLVLENADTYVSMSNRIDRVVITGASSGIGLDLARRFVAEGSSVVINGRDRDKLERARRSLGEARRVVAVAGHVGEPATARAVATAARERFGGVDVLVNNAGLGHRAPLLDADTELWREMLEVNVLALCICTREALRSMHGRGGEGHVIHISSMAAHRVPPGSGVYSASKFAVRALTEALRQELHEAKSAVRVTAIAPATSRPSSPPSTTRARRQRARRTPA